MLPDRLIPCHDYVEFEIDLGQRHRHENEYLNLNPRSSLLFQDVAEREAIDTSLQNVGPPVVVNDEDELACLYESAFNRLVLLVQQGDVLYYSVIKPLVALDRARIGIIVKINILASAGREVGIRDRNDRV